MGGGIRRDALYRAAGSEQFVVTGLRRYVPGFVLSPGFLGVPMYAIGTHEAWVEKHMPEEEHE